MTFENCKIQGNSITLDKKELEDERIRKALIRFHKSTIDIDGIKGDDIVAWLEKQGKPTDINPSEFDLHLNKLLKQFETLPKEEIASSLGFYLNVVQNDGTYNPYEKQGEQKPDNDLPKGEDYGIDGLWHAERILEKTLGEVEGYQSDDGILEHKCAISSIKELKKMKQQNWSGEDESQYNYLLGELNASLNDYCGASLEDMIKAVDWFKSLKNRVQPQPRQELSERDKRIIDNLISQLGNLYARKLIKESTKDKYINWLKSLRPQSQWKPSEGQMKALEAMLTVSPQSPAITSALIELYEQLKKLKC